MAVIGAKQIAGKTGGAMCQNILAFFAFNQVCDFALCIFERDRQLRAPIQALAAPGAGGFVENILVPVVGAIIHLRRACYNLT